jgi:hypothetical protein
MLDVNLVHDVSPRKRPIDPNANIIMCVLAVPTATAGGAGGRVTIAPHF